MSDGGSSGNPFKKSVSDADASGTAGPVTEGFFGTKKKVADEKKVEKKHGIFDDEEYVSDDEPDEGEILEARLHPELRVELKRFGLVILPYQQRAWYWELFSMMNKLLLLRCLDPLPLHWMTFIGSFTSRTMTIC